MIKKHILTVEDDQDSQRLLKSLLADYYRLSIVDSYTDAMNIMDKEQVDLILLDLSLRGSRDGLDLVKDLRKQDRYRDLPVLAVTAHAFTHDRENALNAGCNDYISKPFANKALLEKISHLV